MQIKNLFDFVAQFPDEQACIDYLEKLRWNGNVVSPFDPDSKVYKCKNNRYKCVNTNKYFNVRTKSIFSDSKIDLKTWLLAIYTVSTLKKSISTYDLANELGITQKTAWFLIQRIRSVMSEETYFTNDGGIVSMDETFVGGKNKNRHFDKKVKHSQGRSFKDKTPVFGMLQANDKVKCFVVSDTKASSIQPIIKANIEQNTVIVTDDWWAYEGLDKDYHHEQVRHDLGRYANDNGFSSNPMENFWSHFKRAWVSTHSGRVTPKHLQKYADESSFRYNSRKDSISQKIENLATKSLTKAIKYKTLTAK